MKASYSPTARVYANARLLFSLLTVFVAFTSLFYVGVYLNNRVWQALFAAGVLLLTLLAIPVAYQALRSGHERRTGTILLIGLIVGYGVNEVVWQGLLLYHLIGGVILLLMICNLLLPRAYTIWGIFLAAYLAFLALVNWFPPLPRIVHTQIPMLLVYAIGTNLLMVTAFGGLTAYFSFGRRIRTRMMILMSLLVGIPLLVSGGLSSYQTAFVSQDQITTRLKFDLALRRAEIQGWLDSLKTSLEQVVPSPEKSTLISVLANKGPEPDYSLYRSQLADSLNGLADRSPSILRIYLMNSNGVILFSNDRTLEGINKFTEPFFQEGLAGFSSSPVYLLADTNEPVFEVALPVLDEVGEAVGVLAAEVGFAELNEIMVSGSNESQTGETLFFSKRGLLVSPSRFDFQVGNFYPLSLNLTQAIYDEHSDLQVYTSYRGATVMGAYEWVPVPGVMLVAEKDLLEARLPTIQAVLINLAVMVAAMGLALAAAWYASQRIASPINELALTANAVAAGNLNLMAVVQQQDEVGELAQAFNTMTAQLKNQLVQLEQRVAERTAELEQRSVQLQVAAEIARDASSTQDFDQLIQQAVDLVRERFGYYHAGLFLLDEMGEYAVLRAATGEIGQRMLEHGHKLKLGEEGMVGFVSARGVSRIALDVGDDAVHFRNPDLPLTRSEMALPLKVGARVIGVLDVQSEKEKAFTQEDVVILQTMADQLAVAIENANLLREVQTSLEHLEATYGAYSQQSWRKVVNARKLTGFRYDSVKGLSPLTDDSADAPLTEREPVFIALRVRGQVVGNLRAYPGDEEWSDEQRSLLSALGERVSQAMESARLYEESQQRAANEQVSSAITARMRATMDMDTVLQTTIREIRRAFELQEVEIWLEPTHDAGREVSLASS
jgi:GAF domain-containing protein/HAMP domain-containing protein